eukprot:CAMPEP_0169270802 /NCGR_PEP_ID=MMETSP1016-20121227/49348_1 /TAXON_ID=342587 /ORGANISM="Karlodinium micrum, Strain CCMP2283" /LENGTH=127 /DNA_ID=CAMNT_0009356245 /DNA_START=8 /DNA_END=388 /DNA_ORIENTATION=+
MGCASSKSATDLTRAPTKGKVKEQGTFPIAKLFQIGYQAVDDGQEEVVLLHIVMDEDLEAVRNDKDISLPVCLGTELTSNVAKFTMEEPPEQKVREIVAKELQIGCSCLVVSLQGTMLAKGRFRGID